MPIPVIAQPACLGRGPLASGERAYLVGGQEHPTPPSPGKGPMAASTSRLSGCILSFAATYAAYAFSLDMKRPMFMFLPFTHIDALKQESEIFVIPGSPQAFFSSFLLC